MTTNEGREKKAVYQVAEVTRPLTSVGSTCGQNNFVIYGPRGGCIYSLTRGSQTLLDRRGGIYELDLWPRSGNHAGEQSQPGFARQGYGVVKISPKARKGLNIMR